MSAPEPQSAPWWEMTVRVAVTAESEEEAIVQMASSGITVGAQIGTVDVLEIEAVQGWES